MTNFDEAWEALEGPGEEIGGIFNCQTCFERVSPGYLKEGTLTWTCSKGHVSRIEKFLQ